ncbi:nucleotidyl transferase AbiEii/AbiGii toxin family protein [Magnetospira thiophila]
MSKNMDRRYRETVQLLLDVAPVIFQGSGFAMKGGTAINLFHRDMPRLSVDIDVVYVRADQPREEALNAISQALNQAATDLERRGFSVRRQAATGMGDIKLFVRQGFSEVKIEVNPVGRGTLHHVRIAELCPSAALAFKRLLKLPVLASEELYGSKLVAAMDRQHPRDWFDCLLLRQNEGLTTKIRQAFVAYVAAHNRPINEILTPNPQPLGQIYNSDFVGMTHDDISLEMLEETRDWLFRALPESLTRDERDFLLSLKAGEPDWNLLPFPALQHMPAVKWKLQNIRKLKQSNPRKHAALLTILQEKLKQT